MDWKLFKIFNNAWNGIIACTLLDSFGRCDDNVFFVAVVVLDISIVATGREEFKP